MDNKYMHMLRTFIIIDAYMQMEDPHLKSLIVVQILWIRKLYKFININT